MVAPWKIQEVEELKRMLNEYEVIGLANVMDLPNKQFQIIRKKLKENNIKIKVTKKSLLRLALKEVKGQKKNLDAIEKEIEKGKPITVALLLAKDINPFKLYKILEENKSPAPAKPGAVAPRDIVIPAGPTPFGPGPMIGELSRLGLKVKVEGGKIVVQEDKVVVREGEVIDEKVAELLNKFGIEPLEIGINLVLLWKDGVIYTPSVLRIDEEEYRNNVLTAFRYAIQLMLTTGLPIEGYGDLLVRKAFEDALKLSLNTRWITKDNIELLLKRALSTSISLGMKLPEEVKPEEVKGIKIVEPVREEKKEQEEKKEEKTEEEEQKKQEEALSGLGALFGF